MQRLSSNKFASGICVSTLLIWVWLTQLKFVYPDFVLACVQMVGVIVLTRTLIALDLSKTFVGVIFAFIGGWSVSFLSSVLLEAIYSPTFFKAIKEQIDGGLLFKSSIGWFAISIIYAGAIQAVFLYWLSRPKLGSSGGIHGGIQGQSNNSEP